MIEESLSVDNIFVIVLIFQYFAVPAQYQHRVLFWGILGALVMRGLFIGARRGAARALRVDHLHLRRAARRHRRADGGEAGRGVRRRAEPGREVRRGASCRSPTATTGKHFFVVENGRRYATPLLLVLLLVEATDLIFAVDSIPAIFGITRDPFLVFTSNIFAMLGLRSLFFLLASVVTKFHLLKYGLAVILTFVGVKMLIEHWMHIPILLSLGVVLVRAGRVDRRLAHLAEGDAGERGEDGVDVRAERGVN